MLYHPDGDTQENRHDSEATAPPGQRAHRPLQRLIRPMASLGAGVPAQTTRQFFISLRKAPVCRYQEGIPATGNAGDATNELWISNQGRGISSCVSPYLFFVCSTDTWCASEWRAGT
jgi:hypothetical protein